MKNLGTQIIANLHFLILMYGAYQTYGLYEEHQVSLEGVTSQVAPIEAQITETQKKVKEIQDFSKKTEESKVRVEEVAKNIEAAQKQLPADISDSQILGFFNEEANSLNLRDTNIIPGSESTSTYFIAKPYSFKAVGTYLQFMVFFERMATASRIYNVKSLKLITTSDAKKGRFQMINGEATIEAFRFNPDFKVDRGFEANPVTPQ